MKTIHAFTETHVGYPGYVNVTEQDSGNVSITVRSRGGVVAGMIELDPQQFADFAAACAVHVATPPAAPAAPATVETVPVI